MDFSLLMGVIGAARKVDVTNLSYSDALAKCLPDEFLAATTDVGTELLSVAIPSDEVGNLSLHTVTTYNLIPVRLHTFRQLRDQGAQFYIVTPPAAPMPNPAATI